MRKLYRALSALRRSRLFFSLVLVVFLGTLLGGYMRTGSRGLVKGQRGGSDQSQPEIKPRVVVDPSGIGMVLDLVSWPPEASLDQISQAWKRVGYRTAEQIDQQIFSQDHIPPAQLFPMLYARMMAMNYEGSPRRAYETLGQMRSLVEGVPELSASMLYTVIYLQGVTSLRRGENENCILCRGESSCILPIVPAARHTNPQGSEGAIRHFTEYLSRFPDDLEVRWLLNLAHMTLGQYPDQVDPRYLVKLDHYDHSEFDVGRFRDVGHLVGVNQFTQAGGAIMDDFNNDGLLDIAVTTSDATESMSLLVNTGSGTFEEVTGAAGLSGQLGGLNCVQTDYNNDGYLDIYVIRGAWSRYATRPSLLRNNRDGTFTDVTEDAGLLDPVSSIAVAWADYDNDGWLDMFVCCERQPNRLYRNLGNGRFANVADQTGVNSSGVIGCKGAAWIDYDHDGYPDLFQNYLTSTPESRLYHNNRDGTFEDVTERLGILGPVMGFSCWAWDYDNDGWQDLFATGYEHTLGDVVRGLQGKSHEKHPSCLYRNLGGQKFQDVTKDAGLDMVYCTMGSNFGDIDNDGFLDMYLGTGDPSIDTLVPNRLMKNVGGRRFAEVTASSGTGQLQKGHGVAFGDWDRDGDNDIFIQMGGVVNGDKYHNILFQNPGHAHGWLTVKLTGEKTNRAAIGARLKLVTAGPAPMTIYRQISSGSSFGGNPLQQTIGVGDAERIALLEIYWPTSGTTQSFRDLAVNQSIKITEFAASYEPQTWSPIPLPEAGPETGMKTP